MNTTNTAAKKMKLKSTLRTTEYGTPEPRIVLDCAGMKPREANAALYAIAAEVERASPDAAKWVVKVIGVGYNAGSVAIELFKGDAQELALAQQAMKSAIEKL